MYFRDFARFQDEDDTVLLSHLYLFDQYLFELLWRQLVQVLQFAQVLSVTLVELKELSSTVLQQVQDQTQGRVPGVSDWWQRRREIWPHKKKLELICIEALTDYFY